MMKRTIKIFVCIGIIMGLFHVPLYSASTWKTYRNEKYHFEIKYPCDSNCLTSPPEPYRNAFVEDEMLLPTGTDAQVLLVTFTDETVKEWNDHLEGEGTRFPFSLLKMREALLSPVNRKCQIFEYDSNVVVTECTVILLGGEKALTYDAISSKFGYIYRKYFVTRGEHLWLEITENYPIDTEDRTILQDSSTAPSKLKKHIIAISEVMNTLIFFDD